VCKNKFDNKQTDMDTQVIIKLYEFESVSGYTNLTLFKC